MTLLSDLSGRLGGLADTPAGLVLVAKCTAILAAAWLIHRGLAGRNPRWRVALWRASVAGLALVAGLSCGPPLLRWPVAAEGRPVAVADSPDEPRPRPVASPPSGPEAAVLISISGDDRPAILRRPESGARPGLAFPPVAIGRPEVPARSEVAPPRPARRPGPWLLSAWAAGVVVLASRLALAAFRLSRIVARSAEAPAGLVRDSGEVAGRLGLRRGVPVRLSADLKTPCLAGVRRPVLLMPGGSSGAFGRDDLRAILAHELAHARGHDLAWNLAAHLASIVLWFHPLAWRLRASHAAACDAVCDAVAADLLGDVKSYARTLARLALSVAGPPPATGLAMARSSDVGRRIKALDRKLYHSPLPRSLVMAMSSLGTLFAVLVGGLAVTRAGPSPASPQAPEQPPAAKAEAPKPQAEGGRMAIKAVEAATGGPLEGVSIRFRGQFDGKPRRGTVVTGKDGSAAVAWPAAAKVEYLSLDTSKPK